MWHQHTSSLTLSPTNPNPTPTPTIGITYQLESDKSVLKCFQRACQQSKSHLAVDYIMRYIRSPKSLAAAVTIANHHGRTKIARLIDDYMQNLNSLDDDEVEEDVGSGSGSGSGNNSGIGGSPQYQSHLETTPEYESNTNTNANHIYDKTLKSVLKSDSGSGSGIVSPDLEMDYSNKKMNNKVKFDMNQSSPGVGVCSPLVERDDLIELDDEGEINSNNSGNNLTKLKKKNDKTTTSTKSKSKSHLPPNPFSISNTNPSSTSSPLRQQTDEMNKYTKRKHGSNTNTTSTSTMGTNLFDDMKHHFTASPSPVKKSRFIS